VPLLATLSEIYFTTVDKDWDYEGQAGASNITRMFNCNVIDLPVGGVDTDRAYEKGTKLLDSGCVFSDFGTRRRRSYHTHDLIVSQLVRAQKDRPGRGKLSLTSNVSFYLHCLGDRS
jgi:nicotinate phosphoribosyltransferase